MNLKQAEEIALDAASETPRFPRSLRASAFAWADRKRFDRRVSTETRQRAASVARRIWDAAGETGRDGFQQTSAH